MHYIILDLEWNQASAKPVELSASDPPGLRFEIIEIGAVKVDPLGNVLGEFSELIRPVVHPHLFERIREVVKITEEDLIHARSFLEVWNDFISWCGSDFRFCTWGSMDLTELQRNVDFYGLENPFPHPLLYYDIQKLYSLAFEDGKIRRALDYAVGALALPEDGAFHRKTPCWTKMSSARSAIGAAAQPEKKSAGFPAPGVTIFLSPTAQNTDG